MKSDIKEAFRTQKSYELKHNEMLKLESQLKWNKVTWNNNISFDKSQNETVDNVRPKSTKFKAKISLKG